MAVSRDVPQVSRKGLARCAWTNSSRPEGVPHEEMPLLWPADPGRNAGLQTPLVCAPEAAPECDLEHVHERTRTGLRRERPRGGSGVGGEGPKPGLDGKLMAAITQIESCPFDWGELIAECGFGRGYAGSDALRNIRFETSRMAEQGQRDDAILDRARVLEAIGKRHRRAFDEIERRLRWLMEHEEELTQIGYQLPWKDEPCKSEHDAQGTRRPGTSNVVPLR